jgi:UDP-4-amino-4,6-dideoxy-N-acetyl-beta-L-altrosamine N-acetyltransferase
MDIILRDLKESDIEKVRLWRNSDEVSKYMYTSEKISTEQQINWFNRVKDDQTSKYWVIEYDGKDLGLASLTNINHNLNSCYWAFYLGDSSVRGAGIGGKVEYNIMKYVFENLQLNKLRCEVFVFNDKVISMHEKFGFRREAYYREHCLKDEIFHDVVGLAMLKSEWNSLKNIIYDKVYKRD